MMNPGAKNAFHLCALILCIHLGVSCSDHGLEPPELTAISGTIRYVGEWPANTDWVRIAIYKNFPPPSLFNIFAFSDTLPRFVKKYSYTLELQPGHYEWVVLAWKPVSPFITDIDTLGMYLGPNGDWNHPGQIDLQEGQTLTGIDILADFRVLRSQAGRDAAKWNYSFATDVMPERLNRASIWALWSGSPTETFWNDQLKSSK